MKSLEALLDQFHEHGLRITPQRRVILELLADDKSHPTAEQVYQRVLAVMPDVSRTTVYNTLRELSDLGELTPVQDLSEGGQRYDTNHEAHHHLYCVACHKLIDIDDDFDGLNLSFEEASGYRILSRQVTFYGICPDCQASGTAKAPETASVASDAPGTQN
ncbi:MAG: transcriptional repressor [Anaerolineae bacterium]|nr:transcriptional repressor [Anaerolineae bacterium]